MNKNLRTSDEGTSYCTQCEMYARRIELLEAVVLAARDIKDEPSCLGYPIRDVYGSSIKEDRSAPLWTESGLYGRVGKEAARTLLARHRILCEKLAALNREPGERGGVHG